jgi:Flp pilus assembly protein CpaB
MNELRRRLHRARRLAARFRRVVAAGLAAVTVLVVVHTLAPPPARTTPVVVAAHALVAGSVIGPGDVRTVALPSGVVPAVALRTDDRAVGQVVAGPVAAGEMISSARLVGRSLVAGLGASRVAAPIRIADEDAVRLLRVGDLIDVYAPTSRGWSAPAVVRAALVVTVPGSPTDGTTQGDGALVVVAVSSDEAALLAQAASRAPLSFTMLG